MASSLAHLHFAAKPAEATTQGAAVAQMLILPTPL
jgi:hypothetical protein